MKQDDKLIEALQTIAEYCKNHKCPSCVFEDYCYHTDTLFEQVAEKHIGILKRKDKRQTKLLGDD